MIALHVALLWIHVLCMSFWMGSMLFGLVLGGAERLQLVLGQDGVMAGMLSRLPLAYGVAIPVGILSGILVATVGGPIQSWSVLFGTAYGRTLIAAFLLVTLAAGSGPPRPEKAHHWTRKARLGEIGILGAFTCMMLLRFGL